MLLSIIIPVYNIEDYISDCLDSVLAITDLEYEIIIVLGKSTDNSNIIVERYAKQNDNIIMTFQDGKGLSNARNCGMKLSKGKYLFFLDGDDYIEPYKFKIALQNLVVSEKDVLVSEYRGFCDSNNYSIYSNQIKNIAENDDFDIKMENFLRKKKCFWNVWRYIYKKKFLKINGLRFKEGIYAEDLDFTTDIFLKTESIYFFYDYFYNYRFSRKNSLMNVVSKKRIFSTVNVIENNIEKIYNNNFKYSSLFYKQYSFELILNFAMLYEAKKKDRNEVLVFFYNKIDNLNKDKYIISNIIFIFIKLLGFKNISFFLYLLKKLKRKIKGRI